MKSFISKNVALTAIVLATSSAIADQGTRPALNQQRSDPLVAQLRHSWKNLSRTRVAAPVLSATQAGGRGKGGAVQAQGKAAQRG